MEEERGGHWDCWGATVKTIVILLPAHRPRSSAKEAPYLENTWRIESRILPISCASSLSPGRAMQCAVCSAQCSAQRALHVQQARKLSSRDSMNSPVHVTYDSVTPFSYLDAYIGEYWFFQAGLPTPTVPRPAQPNPHDKLIRVMIVGYVPS